MRVTFVTLAVLAMFLTVGFAVGSGAHAAPVGPVCITFHNEVPRCTCIEGQTGCGPGDLACTQLLTYTWTCVPR
jgi:hypothetical protein